MSTASPAPTPSLHLGKVGYVILSVRDMSRSKAFYRELLGLTVRHDSPGWVEFDAGTVVLVIHPYPGMMPFTNSNAMPEVVFQTDDIHADYLCLRRRGLYFQHAPVKVADTPDGPGLSAEFRDPDGNRMSLYGVDRSTA